jgi:hypothetical protein
MADGRLGGIAVAERLRLGAFGQVASSSSCFQKNTVSTPYGERTLPASM